MDWERVLDWFDNPILVKFARSRLRKEPLLTAIAVVQVLCLCIAWGGYQLGTFSSGGAFATLYALQLIILVLMGSAQVGTSVGGARASGILDFHRASPLSPAELTLGFFFGAPIREYVLFATTLPYTALCLAFGAPSFRGLVQLMILMCAVAWLFHGLALLNGLVAKPKAASRGVVGLVVILVIFGGNLLFGLSRAATLVDYDQRFSFYGISLPWLAFVIIYVSAVLFFIYLACLRKMTSERIHALSKPQALAAMATLSVLLLGGIWGQDADDGLELTVLYLLVITPIVLLPMVTPTQAEYTKGLWRARKQGRSHLPPWDDLALNRVFLLIACTILLVTATAAWHSGLVSASATGRVVSGAFALAIANDVLVVAYFGLAMQYFLLRFGGRGVMYFALFLFLAWIIPLVAGTILMMASPYAGTGESPAQLVFSASPIAGLGFSAVGSENQSFLRALQGMSITPALFYTFIFNTLLVSARRLHHRAFENASGNLQRSDPPLEASRAMAIERPIP
jgi:hypothetical protein